MKEEQSKPVSMRLPDGRVLTASDFTLNKDSRTITYRLEIAQHEDCKQNASGIRAVG